MTRGGFFASWGRMPRARPHPRLGSPSGCWPRLAAAWTVLAVSGCEPTLVVGSSTCTPGVRAGEDGFAPGAGVDQPVTAWSTDFEYGFCDYSHALGFCYTDANASFEIVDTPARSGRHAAAFTITADGLEAQSRCVREGILPISATYGAWFYLPRAPTGTDNWNLIHFQGATGAAFPHYLWDVSLRVGDDGSLHLYLREFLGTAGPLPDITVEAPVGAWFHVEFELVRAADATGRVLLRQDGQELFSASSIVTDDSEWGQWYVGNLASNLTPPESTVYVDDITLRALP
jgi:hypothetical protein